MAACRTGCRSMQLPGLLLALTGASGFSTIPEPQTYAKTIALPMDLQAEGVVGGQGAYLYAGSLADGRIMKVDTATGTVMEHVAALPPTDTLETSERMAVGLCYDALTDAVWASGGMSGEARAFSGETGEMLGAWTVTPNASFGVCSTRCLARRRLSAPPLPSMADQRSPLPSRKRSPVI
jgi:hypothetical protein